MPYYRRIGRKLLRAQLDPVNKFREFSFFRGRVYVEMNTNVAVPSISEEDNQFNAYTYVAKADIQLTLYRELRSERFNNARSKSIKTPLTENDINGEDLIFLRVLQFKRRV